MHHVFAPVVVTLIVAISTTHLALQTQMDSVSAVIRDLAVNNP